MGYTNKKSNSNRRTKKSNYRKSNRKNNRKSNLKTNKRKTNKKTETPGIDVSDALNMYTNFLNIRSQTEIDLVGKKNPETKKRYTRLEILEEADKKFKNIDINKLSKEQLYKPVSLEEGKKIFKKHYISKYGKELGEKKMNRDKARKKTSALLKPNAPDSYKYRPLQGKNKRGPEAYDMVGVDDGSK